MPIAVPTFGAKGAVPPDVSVSDIRDLVVRPAKVGDARAMSALINYYAADNVMLARGPQYLYQHIQDYIVVSLPSGEEETIVACGALHVLWEDLAEIRSIAVHPACQGLGLGKILVDTLVARCENLGIPRAFVFTLVDDFFRKCGFRPIDRKDLPPVVWAECSKCPKFYRCDEISMMRTLKAVADSAKAEDN
ncbi:MAG: N-acetyltransferase [Desulfovibrio sp.]|nr:N-acetyltransferase [Desulfovibrio sp.]